MRNEETYVPEGYPRNWRPGHAMLYSASENIAAGNIRLGAYELGLAIRYFGWPDLMDTAENGAYLRCWRELCGIEARMMVRRLKVRRGPFLNFETREGMLQADLRCLYDDVVAARLTEVTPIGRPRAKELILLSSKG